MEIALKREETARKRKNLSEKKLEDEKVFTPRNHQYHNLNMIIGRNDQSSSQETITRERKT